MTTDALSRERIAEVSFRATGGILRPMDEDEAETILALIDERARLIAAVAESRKVDEALSEHGMTVDGNEVMLKRLRGLRRQLWALDAWKAGT